MSEHWAFRCWLVSNKVSFGALLETHIKELNLNQVLTAICPNWSFLSNHAADEDGRIILVWKKPFSVVLLRLSKQTLTCKVSFPGISDFIFTTVYAANTLEERNDLWIDLLETEAALSLRNTAWLMGGDFNETLHPSEHSQPDFNQITSPMINFKDCLDQLELRDLRYHGTKFTWSNNLAQFLAPDISDHSPCCINLASAPPSVGTLLFKFYNYLAGCSNFLGTDFTPVHCHSLKALSAKQKLIKSSLRSLNKDNYSDIQKRVSEATDLLRAVQLVEATSAEDVGNLAAFYFRNILGSPMQFRSQRLVPLISRFTRALCSPEDASNLACHPSPEEIQKTIFRLNPNKISGSYGLTFGFNKAVWPILVFFSSGLSTAETQLIESSTGIPHGAFSAKVAWTLVTSPKEEDGWELRTSTLGIEYAPSNFSGFSSLELSPFRLTGYIRTLQDTMLMWIRLKPGDGHTTIFWSDPWTLFGPLINFIGPMGPRLMGIPRDATVSSIWRANCWDLIRRFHVYAMISIGVLGFLVWAHHIIDGSTKANFSAKTIYHQIREQNQVVDWSPIIWLKRGIPKHNCLAWLFILNRCPTRDRLLSWGLTTEPICLLCNTTEESRDHLFFECEYSFAVWSKLAQKLGFSTTIRDWSVVVDGLLSITPNNSRKYLMILAWQATIYELWRDRNNRLHRSIHKHLNLILKGIELTIKNRISAFRLQNPQAANNVMQLWMSLY
ncbi:unnamed protein product [Thlaspi arvense]|uniref:Reverse transcriptase zinc-binding domain-containing protein n=1 Tax=Thlaspi arvense TaxID=13288 RepID=A0AAU9T6X5_THLAR|nr:unnamed protein product [Thlaspi arvense]